MIELLDFSNQAESIKRIALVASATRFQHGSTTIDGVSEYDYTAAVIRRTKALLKTDETIRTYTKDHIGAEGVARLAGAFGADLLIEIGFNVHDSKRAGAIAYCRESDIHSQGTASILLHQWKDFSKGSDCEVLATSGNSFGARELQLYTDAGIKSSMIFLPFYADNPRDTQSSTELSNFLFKFISQIKSP